MAAAIMGEANQRAASAGAREPAPRRVGRLTIDDGGPSEELGGDAVGAGLEDRRSGEGAHAGEDVRRAAAVDVGGHLGQAGRGDVVRLRGPRRPGACRGERRHTRAMGWGTSGTARRCQCQ